MILKTYYKQPNETLDYTIDYDEWLDNNVSISTSSITITPAGLTVTKTQSPRKIVLLASSGTNNIVYKITVSITTNTGLVKEDEFNIRILEK